METVTNLDEITMKPALYAMHGGEDARAWVAYVGIAGKLRQRLRQHLVLRDSSIATGVSAVGLNVDAIAFVDWWEDPAFTDRNRLRAAELIAFRVLDPALRSRGGVVQEAERISKDARFIKRVERLLAGEPSGRYIVPRLSHVLRRVEDLERRVRQLEAEG